MPPKHTRLSEGEKLIKEYLCGSLFSSKGIVCSNAPSLPNGNLFLTNKRIIFESLEDLILESTYHADVRRSEGSNMRFVSGGFLEFIKVDGTAHTGYQLKKAGDLSNLLNNNFYSSKIIVQGQIDRAKYHERLLEFDEAAEIYKELGMDDELIRIRKLKAEQGAVKVDQTVVHGDYVDDRDTTTTYIDKRDTIIKDSVVSKSSIGGGSSKMQELKELTEMKKEGLIDDAEFQQMKKEILGK